MKIEWIEYHMFMSIKIKNSIKSLNNYIICIQMFYELWNDKRNIYLS